jgi:hypothetical protein
MAIYVGVNGVPKEVTAVYVGVNGTPKEVNEIYAGKSNSPAQVYSAAAAPGETVFTSSGTFTVPKGVKSIDVFCVGGGGGGTPHCYSGGGGGYTTTTKAASVTPGQSIAVTIGTCSYFSRNYGGPYEYYANGTSTSVGSICTAKGGYGSNHGYYQYDYSCSGGSAGGVSITSKYPAYNTSNYALTVGNDGGSNGGFSKNDIQGYYTDAKSFNAYFNVVSYHVSEGQGTTTRYFGESNGTLYAGGGAGAGINFSSGSVYISMATPASGADTYVYKYYTRRVAYGGDGGGGNGQLYSDYSTVVSYAVPGSANTGGGGGAVGSADTYSVGGSGIAIIRWGKK